MVSRYPRAGECFRLKSNTTHRCQYTRCSAQATHYREIQFGFMRGTDDVSVNVCNEHKRIPGGDVQTWIGCFPPETWKGPEAAPITDADIPY